MVLDALEHDIVCIDIDDTYTSNSLMFRSADRAICDVIYNMTRVSIFPMHGATLQT